MRPELVTRPVIDAIGRVHRRVMRVVICNRCGYESRRSDISPAVCPKCNAPFVTDPLIGAS